MAKRSSIDNFLFHLRKNLLVFFLLIGYFGFAQIEGGITITGDAQLVCVQEDISGNMVLMEGTYVFHGSHYNKIENFPKAEKKALAISVSEKESKSHQKKKISKELQHTISKKIAPKKFVNKPITDDSSRLSASGMKVISYTFPSIQKFSIGSVSEFSPRSDFSTVGNRFYYGCSLIQYYFSSKFTTRPPPLV